MPCDDVRRVIYFLLDGSLGASKKSDLEQHLHDCPDCGVRVVIQRRLRQFVRSRLTPVAAPDHLRVRLTQSLRLVAE